MKSYIKTKSFRIGGISTLIVFIFYLLSLLIPYISDLSIVFGRSILIFIVITAIGIAREIKLAEDVKEN